MGRRRYGLTTTQNRPEYVYYTQGCRMKYSTLNYLKISNFEIFQDPFFEIVHEIFNFHYKVHDLKLFNT